MSQIQAKTTSHVHAVVVDDVPTPYRLALFKDIAALGTIRLSVIYLSAHGKEKQWHLTPEGNGFDIHYLRNIQLYVRSLDTRLQVSWGAGRTLHHLQPDVVVVGGYHQVGYWRCLLYCLVHKVPLIIWSGSTLASEWRPGNPLTRQMKRFFVRRANRAFAYGTASKRFLEALGMTPDVIHKLYNSTDLRAFRDRWLIESASQGNRGDVVNFLFTGRLTPYKGLQRVLAALSRVQGHFHFRVVGDGPYRAEAESLAASLGLCDRVEFVGYVQQDQLPEHLAWADVFVFSPTQEVWGIVVNEALAAGLFVLSSTLAGVTEDLIILESTGVPVDPLSEDSIYQGLAFCMDNIEVIRGRRDERSRWSMQFSTQETRHEFVRGVTHAATLNRIRMQEGLQ